MNEFGILMNLLSQTTRDNDHKILHYGTSEKILCQKLNFTGINTKNMLYQLFVEFSKAIQPFGLDLCQNPFTHNWFLRQTNEYQNMMDVNIFDNKPRLAATLATIISLCLINAGSVSISKIAEIRQKKDISSDLIELEKMHFIVIQDELVNIHSTLGYYMDLDAFLNFMEELASKMSKEEK